MTPITQPMIANAIAWPTHDTAQLVRMGVKMSDTEYVVALAGNPNTGKSTVFNSLTGLHQHTGNWPGKTVARAEGGFVYAKHAYKLVDLPGTYSLLATSVDEEIARDFLLFGRPDVTIVVVDACRLERNLNLALQVLAITDRVVICLNLMDEARRRRVTIDVDALADQLGVPVTATSARYDQGIDELLQTIDAVATGRVTGQPRRLPEPGLSVREVVDEMTATIERAYPELPNARWVSLRLLDNDQRIRHAVLTGELGDVASDTPTSQASQPSPSTSEEDDSARRAVLARADSLRWRAGPHFHQRLVEGIYSQAASVADRVVTPDTQPRSTSTWDRKLDRVLTNRWTGFPIMILMLVFVLWLTVAGANLPSAVLSWLLLDTIYPLLKSASATLHVPIWLDGLLLDGVYLATAWVVAVMLPPMAIFFPLFTLLEDFGLLPRVAFNLDRTFRRCGAHGKQALTMCMGFGCNAAGVVATRVIDSPRERLLAILTNNFALCNGRWPTQILIAAIFLGALVPPWLSGIASAAAVVLIALVGILATFVTSWGLSKTLLRGEPSSFHLELPPYRPPRVLQTLYTSLIDRTLIVLWRAILFAVPAGAVIWLLANVSIGNATVAEWSVRFLDPVGYLIGLNGVILLAYIVAIPANEIVIPTILMLTVLTARLSNVGAGDGVIFESESVNEIAAVLHEGSWTLLTGVNLMLFSLLHNPCSTTIFTIWKETRSWRWTIVATILPLVLGIGVCYIVSQVWQLVAL